MCILIQLFHNWQNCPFVAYVEGIFSSLAIWLYSQIDDYYDYGLRIKLFSYINHSIGILIGQECGHETTNKMVDLQQ